MAENTEIQVQHEATPVNTEEDTLFDAIPSRELLMSMPQNRIRAIYLFITGTYSIKKIAQIVGMHEMTVRKWFYDENVQKVVKELQERETFLVEQQLKALRERALNTMNDLMDSPLDPVRFQASKDILDRTGHKAVQEMKIDKTVTTFETQMKNIVNATITDAEVIDVVTQEVEDEYTRKYGSDTE